MNMNITKLKIANNIKEIDKILKGYWKDRASNEKPLKPKLKIIFVHFVGEGEDRGYIYAYDIDDGYFHDCILDDIVTGTKENLNEKVATKLIKKLIDYCRKKNIETIRANLSKNRKKEMNLFKKLNFEIDTNEVYGRYHL